MVAVATGLAALLGAGLAEAKIYTYTDAKGVVHYTNAAPAGKAGPKSGQRSPWKELAFGPGKAQSVSAAVSSSSIGGSGSSGCDASRASIVPARDRSPERYWRYDAYIAEASRLYAIPEALIRAVIKVESDYDPRVVSCAGAKGLMQLMPDTERSQHVEHVFDPRENILGGTRLLRVNANRWRGDLRRSIAAYHAGNGAVAKYHGVPPYQTTQTYVEMVLKQYERYRQTELAAAEPREERTRAN